jgi:hypothetical protein
MGKAQHRHAQRCQEDIQDDATTVLEYAEAAQPDTSKLARYHNASWADLSKFELKRIVLRGLPDQYMTS